VNGLDSTERELQFWVLVGADATSKGDQIVGKWRDSRHEWRGGSGRTLTEQFLNCPTDPTSILRFTEKFGPLHDRFGGGERFEFSVADWRRDQSRLKGTWWLFSAKGGPPADATAIQVHPGEEFVIEAGALTYHCANLLSYMGLEIAFCPPDRLRSCERSGCNQHFVVADLKQKYCSETCAGLQRKQSKLEYWNRNKKRYLKAREQARNTTWRKNHGTGEAR